MENQFSYKSGQKFACQDCPSRCCKNWTIDITGVERDRFKSTPWVEERLNAIKADFFTLSPDLHLMPMLEKDRQMQCAFLDPDGLCGLHKQFGHDFLAITCKTFPFDFVEGEKGEVIAVTSQVCPSIRDNYGIPLDHAFLENKLKDSGGVAKKQREFLKLSPVTRLNLSQYSAIFREWEKLLEEIENLPLALALCFHLTESMAAVLKDRAEWESGEFLLKLEEVRQETLSPQPQLMAELLLESKNYHRVAKVLMVSASLPLTYPFRSRILFQGIRKPVFLKGVLESLFHLITSSGNIDVLYLGESIPLSQNLWKNKAVKREQWGRFRDFLLKTLRARKFSMLSGNLNDILMVMVVALSSYGFFAKLRAAGLGREIPNQDDFKEALSAVEMGVLHQSAFLGGKNYGIILEMLLKVPNVIPRLLTAEISFEELNPGSVTGAGP